MGNGNTAHHNFVMMFTFFILTVAGAVFFGLVIFTLFYLFGGGGIYVLALALLGFLFAGIIELVTLIFGIIAIVHSSHSIRRGGLKLVLRP